MYNVVLCRVREEDAGLNDQVVLAWAKAAGVRVCVCVCVCISMWCDRASKGKGRDKGRCRVQKVQQVERVQRVETVETAHRV